MAVVSLVPLGAATVTRVFETVVKIRRAVETVELAAEIAVIVRTAATETVGQV